MNQQEILQEDVKIIWDLMTSARSASLRKTLLAKHLEAMARRHGEDETKRCAERVLKVLEQELARVRSGS